MASAAAKRYGILAIVGLSTPFALVVETAVRRVMMPPEFDDVRAWLRPDVTPWAWAMVPLAIVATGLGFWLQRWLLRRAMNRPAPGGLDPARHRERAEFDALMLSTSAPQLPALMGTVTFMVGAELTPVLVTMAVATVGVVSLGLAVGRGEPQREA